MTVVRAFEDDDYLPEYGLLVLRDRDVPADLPLPRRADDEVTGTFAGAGAGWVTCSAGDGHHVVRLELLDAAPASDQASFDDVLETPFLAGAGGLSLTYLTGGAGRVDLDLGGGGGYRVRVARRRGDTPDGAGDRWLLRFWPDPALSPPVWLARSRPAVGPGYDGWQSEIQYEPMELAGIIGAAAREHGGPVTLAQVEAWGRTHHRPEGWLDAPFWQPPRPPLTTGHADLDQRRADQHAEIVTRLSRQQDRLDEIAAELGVPPVRRKRDAVPLLVAAGILAGSDASGYRTRRPQRVDKVLSLPPDRVRSVQLQDARGRYGELAEDLRSLLRWSPAQPWSVAAASLAARLLVSEVDLRGALAFAASTNMLHFDEAEILRLWLGPRPTPAPPAAPAPAAPMPAVPTPAVPRPAPPAPPRARPIPRPASGGKKSEPVVVQGLMGRITYNGPVGGSRLAFTGRKQEPDGPQPPPFGAPPRAGLVEASGVVVVWRNGERVELAQLESGFRRTRALETVCGTLVADHDRAARLVSATGEVTGFDEVRAPLALMGDGRRVAVIDSEHHRLESRYRLRIIDLTGGPAETMPWPADRAIALLGAHRDTVYFSDRQGHGITMRWTPGTDPERHPHPVNQVDPLTGTTTARTAEGITVTRPDGNAVTVPIDLGARLAPGGAQLWTTRSSPAAVTLFPLHLDHPVEPQVWWLPEDGRRSPQGVYGESVWEDPDHLLLSYQPWHFPPEPACGIRLSVQDGAIERLPAAGLPGQPVIFVEPLLTPHPA
ncbi:hypothetical protein OHA21_09155 [Actinoplanes sp. NBC_00393]|uniref:hypothetical protein n=1 Tax=Actinoplanes sp. NBC_00393 TaxID=2975953 RepID=UPI002E1DC2E7